MSTSRGAHGVGANLLRRAGAASKLNVPGWFGAAAVFLAVGILVGGILAITGYIITRVVLYGPSDPTNPLAVSYCTRACDVGELLVQGVGCMECVNAFGGGGSTIELSNTLACSSTTGVCSVTRGSGTNLTIASLTGSGLAVVTKAGDVVTVTAELPSDVFPLCAGACAANSVLRLHSSGDCYECVVPLTSCANGDVCGVLSSVGPAVAMNGYVAGSGMTITNTAGGTVFSATSTQISCSDGDVCAVDDGVGPVITLHGYVAEGGITIANGLSGTVFSVAKTNVTCANGDVCGVSDGYGPDIALNGYVAGAGMTITNTVGGTVFAATQVTVSCTNGDVCGVLNGTGPDVTMNGYVAGNGIAIENTANGTVFSTPEPITTGNFMRLPRQNTTQEMTLPWLYSTAAPVTVITTDNPIALSWLTTRTWLDTTLGPAPTSFTGQYNNTAVLDMTAVVTVTWSTNTTAVAAVNMSGLWYPIQSSMAGWISGMSAQWGGLGSCTGYNGDGALFTTGQVSQFFDGFLVTLEYPGVTGAATFTCNLHAFIFYSVHIPTFSPYDGLLP